MEQRYYLSFVPILLPLALLVYRSASMYKDWRDGYKLEWRWEILFTLLLVFNVFVWSGYLITSLF